MLWWQINRISVVTIKFSVCPIINKIGFVWSWGERLSERLALGLMKTFWKPSHITAAWWAFRVQLMPIPLKTLPHHSSLMRFQGAINANPPENPQHHRSLMSLSGSPYLGFLLCRHTWKIDIWFLINQSKSDCIDNFPIDLERNGVEIYLELRLVPSSRTMVNTI